ncbi:hypothetical protein ACU4GD_26725, partial [Cupriavidus basilensis]
CCAALKLDQHYRAEAGKLVADGGEVRVVRRPGGRGIAHAGRRAPRAQCARRPGLGQHPSVWRQYRPHPAPCLRRGERR